MSSPITHAVKTVSADTAFERFARAGYVARGVIYVLIGVLAIQLARGFGSEASQEGAMRLIARQPFGRALLVVLAVGLAGYTLWRATQALRGRTPEAGSHSAFDRIGAFGSACAYGLFSATAIGILSGSSSDRGAPRQATADILGWPAGRVIVIVAGVVFLGVGAYQATLAVSRRFLKDSKTMYMTERGLRRFTALGVIGHLARTVTFGLVGVFLVKAAAEFDPAQAKGLDGSLQELTTHTLGTAALVIVATGLIAFGIYSIVDARYRKI